VTAAPAPTVGERPGATPETGLVDGTAPRAGHRPDPPLPFERVCRSFTLPAANFDTNSAALRPEATAAIARLVAELATTPGVVDVIGHTDSRPTAYPGGNLELSRSRARTVADALVHDPTGPLSSARLGVVDGRGDAEPVDLGTSEAALARNRRVEVLVRCLAAGG
jgi:outer membrane protein OmpA-like peptidoglycan-associated protein